MSEDHVHQVHHRVCNLCEAMCGLEVTLDSTALDIGVSPAQATPAITIKPDRKDPFSRGSMCPKAPMLGAIHTDPERLREPVKRDGDRWVSVTWEEAYEIACREIKRIRSTHGADAMASYLGNPIVHNLGMTLYIKELTAAIGSRNVFSATSMDQLPHHFAAHYMFGHEFRIPVPDVNRTDFMIIMGANPIASNGSIMTSAGIRERLKAVRERGGQLVVIDPRRTETAELADTHHFIRPATDVYFLLAFVHVLFRDSHADAGRLTEHIQPQAFMALAGIVSAEQFSPVAVEGITGISATNTESLVHDYMQQGRAVLYGRMGLSTQPHGGLCHWLINTINILSGHFDTPGGMMFPTPAIELARGRKQPDAHGRWVSRVRSLPEFYGELPVSSMTEEMLTPGQGQVKGFVTVCGNPVLSTPNGKRLEQALPELEFMMSIDNYINETTRHANLILPTPCGLEIDHYDIIFNLISVSNNVKFSQALIAVDESRPYDWQILKRLIAGVSQRRTSWLHRWSTPRRLINLGLMLGAYGCLSHPKRWFKGLSLKKVIASGHGIDLGPLQPRVPEGLLTADHKIHLAPKVFTDAIQALAIPDQSHSNANLQLIGRRHVSTNNSWMHQYRKLSASRQVRCTAMMHPLDAQAHKVTAASNVRVSSEAGSIELPVEITDSVMPGVICIPHGFGHHGQGTRVSVATLKAGVSVNDITSELQIDSVTGNAAFSGLQLQIEAVDAPGGDGVALEAVFTGKPLLVAYGSRTGNAEFLARDLGDQARQHGLLADVRVMSDLTPADLQAATRVLMICSTYGEGDMPDNAESLWQQLLPSSDEHSQREADFSQIGFAVLALGDLGYETFCQAGKNWDAKLAQLGAKRVFDRQDCDVDYEQAASTWIPGALDALASFGDQSTVFVSADALQLEKNKTYSRKQPWDARLMDKQLLSGAGSSQEIYHYALSIDGANWDYKTGDSVNVIPVNSDAAVDALLQCFANASTAEPSQRAVPADELLMRRLANDLEWVRPSKALLQHLVTQAHDSDPSLQELQRVLHSAAALDTWLDGRDVIDLLNAYPQSVPDIETLSSLLTPMQARSYSIASSVLVHPDEMHITVSTVRRERGARDYPGLGSGYLADQVEIGSNLKIYPAPSSAFTLPSEIDAPIIMIGPGTGLAPFRGFLQERSLEKNASDAWLFFGNPHRKTDFLYEQELQSYLDTGALTKLDLAFSRDQSEKIYVQDKIREHGAEMYQWLERGAVLYVCGDASRMAADVEQALLDILRENAQLEPAAACQYLVTLRENGRYLRDVY